MIFHNKDSRGCLKVFGLGFLAALIAFGWSIIAGGGRFALAGDFNSQQVVFAMHANALIKSGQIGFDYALDLGSGFIGGMAFYILGNPSFWISLLFPAKAFMYIVGWLYILKYAAAALTAYLYIRRYVKDSDSAVIGGLLYAFSGFSAEAILFYHFHDVVYLFPLLLLTFDRLMTEKKRGPFLAAVFFNAIVCYYFFVGEVIFLILYYLVVYVDVRNLRLTLSRFVSALTEGVLGGCLGLALLLPAALFTLQNPRVGNDYYGFNSLVYGEERYLFILKALLFPGEVMSNQSAVIERNFATCSAYLPLLGIVLVLAFVKCHRKHWLTRMLGVCLVFALVPILNASFGLFAGLYCRWYYMAVLMLALASASVTEEWKRETAVFTSPTPTQKAISRSAVIVMVTAAAFILFLLFVPWSEKEPSKIYEPAIFAAWSLVCVLGIALTWLLYCRPRRQRMRVLTGMVVLFAAGTTAAAVAMYSYAGSYDGTTLYQTITAAEALDREEPAYRYSNQANEELLSQGIKNGGVFCSTVSGSIFRLYEVLDLERSVRSPELPEGMDLLISARYTFEDEAREGETPILTYDSGAKTYYVYENDAVPPIGFVYHSYITREEFDALPSDDKVSAMLRTLVVPEADAETVSAVLVHDSVDLINDLAGLSTREEAMTAAARAHQTECSREYAEDAGGFRSVITADGDGYAFFSIPNDDGWSAAVNGEAVPIVDINGFMAVRVADGDNEIVFTYETPGLKAGLAGSAAAGVLTILYLGFAAVRRRRGLSAGKH